MFSWNQLHRGVKAIFFVQIVNRMGDFVIPFLTLILTQVQGLGPAEAGLVVTLATALGSLGGLAAGHLADRHSRRDVLVAFLGTSGVLLTGAGFAPAHGAALAAMTASGFFLGAMRPLLGALVADLCTPETRRAAFSLSYLGINLGVAVGPLLAGWLFTHALNWMFWLDGLSTACALLLLVRFVPRQTRSAPEAGVGEPVPTGALRAFAAHPVLLPFGLLLVAYNLVYSQMVFTLALQLVDLFGAAGPGIYGLVWGVNAVVVVVLTPGALRLTRNRTNLWSMAWATVLVAAGLAVFLFRPDLVWVLGSTLLWSAGEVLFSIHLGDLVAGQSPPEYRARFQGYVSFLGSLGFVAAPVGSGLLASALGLPSLWWTAVVVSAAVGAGFLALDRHRT